MKAALVNGSLRGSRASTGTFLDELERRLGSGNAESTRLQVNAKEDGGFTAAAFEELASADAVVLAFPLFVYCLPGALMSYLERWYRMSARVGADKAKTRVYAIVNSAHAEPEINAEAIRVIANFCRRAGLSWRFAIAIGCGPLVKTALGFPLAGSKARKAFAAMAEDIASASVEPRKTILVRPPLPKGLIFWIRDTFFLNRRIREAKPA